LARQRWTRETVAAYLMFISALYLALPHLIFFVGWLRWYWALLAAGAVGMALYGTWRSALQSIVREQVEHAGEVGSSFVFTREHALMIGGICLIWLTIAGIGGFVPQDYDWNKHNTVLNSLILKPWPTIYRVYKVDIPLIYYIGYYLPAALIGKIGGWFWANVALFVWSFVGLFIALLWFCILVRRVTYAVLAVFIVFSGLDVIGKGFSVYTQMWRLNPSSWQHIDPWTGFIQYSSNATLLNWVPHQALAGWIITGMLLYCLVRLRRREIILLPFGLSAFWSPFVTIGLIPYLVLDFLIDKEPWGQRIRRLFSIPNLVGIVALAITGFYFASKVIQASPIITQDLFSGLSIDGIAGTKLDAVIFVLFFCLLEFGLYVMILYRSGVVDDERWRWMFDITVLTLCILPWFKFGVYNDLVMRASIPALFVLAVVFTRAIHDARMERQTRIALIVVLLIGAVTPWIEFKRHIDSMASNPSPIFDEHKTPMDMTEYMLGQTIFFSQYSGSLQAPFFRYAARPPSANNAAKVGTPEDLLNRHDFILFGRQVYLLRDKLGLPAEIEAGTTITVPWQLHFNGPADAKRYDPTLRLVDAEGTTVWQRDTWPGSRPGLLPFSITQWSGEMTVTVPITATPGIYALEMGFHASGVTTNLIAYAVPGAKSLGEIIPVTETVVVKKE
jgi:hypothetical protein